MNGQSRSSTPPRGGRRSVIESLTNRELDVLELLVRRLEDKEIAAQLCISPHTVRGHLKRLYRKLGVSGRRDAVRRALQLGILPPQGE